MDTTDGKADFRNAMLRAPEAHMDSALKDLIRKWDTPPKALQILEVLDKAIHGGGASEFVIDVLQIGYDKTLADEGKTHEEVVLQAVWRGPSS